MVSELYSFFGLRRTSPQRRRPGRQRRRQPARLVEALEHRRLLATDLQITEILAANQNGIRDGYGDASDWIEIYNAGDESVDLAGYYLTDEPEDLDRWTFPPTSLGPREFLTVFASGRGASDPHGNLHTNFRLSRSGEFVALVAPDGQTIESEITFPEQREDVAYGMGQEVKAEPLLAFGANGTLKIPTEVDRSVADRWMQNDFADTTWTHVQTGVGFGGEATTQGDNNIAQGASVEASGPLWSGFVAGRLTDGDRTTISHPAAPVTSFSYTIDLGEEKSLGRIDIYNRADGCCPDRLTDYRVSVHDDDEGSIGPAVWSADVRTDGSNSGAGGLDRIDAAMDANGDFAGRYLVIEKIDTGATNYWPQIAEVEVFPSLGYEGLINTDIGASMKDVSSSAWLRLPFNVPAETRIEQLLLDMHYDDGFVAYINGIEVARRQAVPDVDAIVGVASSSHQGSVSETILLPASTLTAGDNVLAIQGLNESNDDEDFLIVPSLSGQRVETESLGFLTTPTPGSFNGERVLGFLPPPIVDHPRGFYEEPIAVGIRSSHPGATLVYTTDGSAPTLTQGIRVEPPDENSTAEATVTLTTTAVVRAAIFAADYASSPIQTNSYLFLHDVIRQPARPEGMPTQWAGNSPDYEMDPDVVDDPAYTDRLLQGLRSIPTLSVVTDNDSFWDPDDGIYIHSTQRGADWERPVSLELIQPDGTAGFQVDAGIRMWGTGWAPHSSSRKHSFQLKFKTEYGPSKLEYPLFPDAPVNVFDDIVLRAQGSRSWYDFRQPDIGQSQYLRDAFARDTARDMGKLEGHATFVHLYLNGLYWGLYNPVERTNEKFGEEYLGGDADDYDVINKRSGQATHATSGNMDAWNTMMDLADAGLESAESYAAIQQYLDVDDFIDYMLLQQYATNHDGPDQGGNNMRAIRRRDDTGRFTFHVWDMEYTLWYPGEHRNIDGDVPDSPMRLFKALRENSEFRLRFADRVQMHLVGDGALTPEKSAARYLARATEIDTAIIAESARWGDGRRAQPYTRDVEWVTERDRLLNEYFPVRTQILLDQLQRAGLYPDVAPPEFSRDSGPVAAGSRLYLSSEQGTIYYTTDGTDPRQADNSPSASARSFVPRTSLTDNRGNVDWLVPADGSWDGRWTQAELSGLDQWHHGTLPLGYERRSPTEFMEIPLQNATATFSADRQSVFETIDGDLGGRGWSFSQPVDFQGPVIRAPIAAWETQSDIDFPEGAELRITLINDSRTRANLGRFRVMVTGDPRDDFADGLESSGDVTANWYPLEITEIESAEEATFQILADGSILVSGGDNRRDTYTIFGVSTLPKITGMRLETIKDATLPGRGGPGRGPGGVATLSEIQLAARSARIDHRLQNADADRLSAAVQAASDSGAGKSVYLRIPFTLSEIPDYDRLELALAFPDAFVAYLNGQAIRWQGATPGQGFDESASTDRPGREMHEVQVFDITDALPLLQTGENVLAVHIVTQQANETATYIAPQLTGIRNWDVTTSSPLTVLARTLDGDQWSAIETRSYLPAGDVNGDHRVDAQDIDAVCQGIQDRNPAYDLNGDAKVNEADHRYLIQDLLDTVMGDVNLDGIFDSSDLVLAFQAGLYEQVASATIGWLAGDWNCDRAFTANDLIDAFASGKYSRE